METMKWEKVERLATAKGLRKKQIADVMAVYPTRISDWIAGGTWRPDLNQALRLARLLDVPLEYLADDEMDEIPRPELTDAEIEVLKIVRKMGTAEAEKRLLNLSTTSGGQDQEPDETYRGGSVRRRPPRNPDASGDDKPSVGPLPTRPGRVS